MFSLGKRKTSLLKAYNSVISQEYRLPFLPPVLSRLIKQAYSQKAVKSCKQFCQ